MMIKKKKNCLKSDLASSIMTTMKILSMQAHEMEEELYCVERDFCNATNEIQLHSKSAM